MDFWIHTESRIQAYPCCRWHSHCEAGVLHASPTWKQASGRACSLGQKLSSGCAVAFAGLIPQCDAQAFGSVVALVPQQGRLGGLSNTESEGSQWRFTGEAALLGPLAGEGRESCLMTGWGDSGAQACRRGCAAEQEAFC